MIDVARPLTLCQWSPLEDRQNEWPQCANLPGTFGMLPSPYTVPNYLWLVAQNPEGADDGIKFESSNPNQIQHDANDSAYVVIEKGDDEQDWHMGIEYIYVEPSMPSVKSIGQWLDSVLVRLGLLKNKGRGQWFIAYHALQDMKYLDCGAQGFVYLAKLNDELVAVKKLRSKCSIIDFNHLRQLSHPNLVTFKGTSISADAECCLVMEYCPYGQLCQFLGSIESLPPARLADWSRQIASGMLYLHENSIIHRDLKSPNVLISHGNLLKICDFDTSRQVSGGHCRQMSLGTIAWMAPEMIRNEPCSEKIDIWSYGVLLWELVTLEMPYRNFETIAIMFGVGNGTLSLPMPTQFTPDTAALGELMQQCWSIEPNNRPTFLDILHQLDPISDLLNSIDSKEFHQLQVNWNSQVHLIQSRIRSRSTCHSNRTTPWQTVDSAQTSLFRRFEGAKRRRRNSQILLGSIEKMHSTCVNVFQRKRKLSESDESHPKAASSEAIELSLFRPIKKMKHSASSTKKSVNASQSRSQTRPAVDANVLKYLYYLILRTCK